MKIPIKRACAVCGKDLTAKLAVTHALGHATKALRAPPRARVTYEVGGGVAAGVKKIYVELWLCEAHAYPGDAALILTRAVLEAERK